MPYENNLLSISGQCDDVGHDFITQIKMACQGLLCFYITGHGIENSLMESLLKCANNFFNLQTDVKQVSALRKALYIVDISYKVLPVTYLFWAGPYTGQRILLLEY